MNEIKEGFCIRKKISRLYGGMSARKKRLLDSLAAFLVGIVIFKGVLFLEERVSREIYQLCFLLFIAVWGLGFFVISKGKKDQNERLEGSG